MTITRRTSKALAIGAAAGGALAAMGSAQAQQATQVVVVTGHRDLGSLISFDSYLTANFSFGSAYAFSAPEGEAAYLASVYAQWIKTPVTPKAAMTIDMCAMRAATEASKAVTRNSEDAERRAAANQVFYGSLPNFVNTQRDGLIVAIIFSDGSQEQYRHTSLYGLQPMAGTFIPGSGVPGCG